MKVYQCERCLKIFKRSDYLVKHMNRKFICSPKNDEKISIKKASNKHQISIKKASNKHQKSIKKASGKSSSDLSQISNQDFEEFSCKYCQKNFKKKDYLYKHINQLRCPKMSQDHKNLIILKRNNKILSKRLEDDTRIAELINNTNSNNTNISYNNSNNTTNTFNNKTTNNICIKINPFGQENTDFLTKKDKMKIMNKCYMSVPALIKTIHNRPENRNFFIKNINDKVMAYLNDNNEVVFNDYNSVCDKLIQNNITRIDKFLEELNCDIKENTKSRVAKMLEESNTGELTEKYIQDIKFYLMTISKKNKKDLNDFIDKLEAKIREGS